MILHILSPEKFADYAIDQFSQLSIPSEFVLIPFGQSLELVKSRDKARIVPYRGLKYKELLQHLGDYTGIVLHSTHFAWAKDILKAVPDDVKVAWVFWGGEIYSRPEIKDTQYAPITKFVIKLRSVVVKPKKENEKRFFIPYELYQRIDYCLTGETEEYEYAKAFLNHPTLKHLWYTYYDMNATLGTLREERCNGNNVVVGNSATKECNYFDVIPRLCRHLQKGQKVVLPLSYGTPWVMNAVPKYAKFWLGKRSWVLSEFMEREKYNRILQSCSTMIMAQYNPQAQGNILTGLWLGMRVYMSEKSIAYRFFKRLGFVVFSFESDFKKFKLTQLTEAEFAENRKVLNEWYSAESVQKAVYEVLKELSTPKMRNAESR